MKLFYQLTEQEQKDAISHCVSVVLDDIINADNMHDIICDHDDQCALKIAMEDAVEQMEKCETEDQKIDILMEDEIIAEAVFEMAENMSGQIFYHEDNEMTVYISDITEDSENETEVDEVTETSGKKNKKESHSLN